MAAQFQFVMRSGPTPGATFALEGDQLIIGRDATSGIAINDAEVSRKHARLTFQGGKYVLEDLGSTNGTFVNGQRLVSSAVLKPGDVVSLGEQIVLMYEGLTTDAGATMISHKAPPKPTAVAAPVASAASCQGTMFEWCSKLLTRISSPGFRNGLQHVATRLRLSVHPLVKITSASSFASCPSWPGFMVLPPSVVTYVCC